MTTIEQETFDPNERIAGFSLAAIAKVLACIGLGKDRDDVENTGKTLGCPLAQSERVLKVLEQRGLVVSTKNSQQWDTTPKGKRFAAHWQTPRKFRPAIDAPSSGERNEGFVSIRCSILRATSDGEGEFEASRVEAAFNADFDGDELVEICVLRPEDVDATDAGGGIVETIVHMTPKTALELIDGIRKAIEKAEREIARRVRRADGPILVTDYIDEWEMERAVKRACGMPPTTRPRRHPSRVANAGTAAQTRPVPKKRGAGRVAASPSTTTAAAPNNEAAAERRRTREPIAAALAEARATNRARREGKSARSE